MRGLHRHGAVLLLVVFVLGEAVAPVLHNLGHATQNAALRAALARQAPPTPPGTDVLGGALPEGRSGHPTCVYCTHLAQALPAPGTTLTSLPPAAQTLVAPARRPWTPRFHTRVIRGPPFSS